jgi:hypothetical protein
LQQSEFLFEGSGQTSTSMSSLGFPGGSLESMDWDVAVMLQAS